MLAPDPGGGLRWRHFAPIVLLTLALGVAAGRGLAIGGASPNDAVATAAAAFEPVRDADATGHFISNAALRPDTRRPWDPARPIWVQTQRVCTQPGEGLGECVIVECRRDGETASCVEFQLSARRFQAAADTSFDDLPPPSLPQVAGPPITAHRAPVAMHIRLDAPRPARPALVHMPPALKTGLPETLDDSSRFH